MLAGADEKWTKRCSNQGYTSNLLGAEKSLTELFMAKDGQFETLLEELGPMLEEDPRDQEEWRDD